MEKTETQFPSDGEPGRDDHRRDSQERPASTHHLRANVRQDPCDQQRRRAKDEPAVRHATGKEPTLPFRGTT